MYTYIFNVCVLLSFKFSAHTNTHSLHGCKMFKNADGQAYNNNIYASYTLKLIDTSRGFGIFNYMGTNDKK